MLGIDQVGVDDNFFDLGGHSLLVARVRFNLRQQLQKEISLVDFFSYPTVRLLAQKLEHGGEGVDVADIGEDVSRPYEHVLSRQHEEDQASE
jgi:acyl carrier protein